MWRRLALLDMSVTPNPIRHLNRLDLASTLRSVCRRFGRETMGAAAVEFAIVGTAFTMLVCFITELGLTLLMQATLNEATRAASRLIRIGSIQQSGGLPGPFAAALCAKASVMMDCSAIRFNVVSGTSFASLPTAIQTDSNAQMINTQFVPGTAEQDVVVQVGYTRTLYFPLLRDVIGNNGKLLIVSTVVFQNEPY